MVVQQGVNFGGGARKIGKKRGGNGRALEKKKGGSLL